MKRAKKVWENYPNTTTPIDAESLNGIEDILHDMTQEKVTNIDLINVSGSGIIARFGNVCQMTLTFVDPAPGSGTDTVIGSLPDGFKGYIDFTVVLPLDANKAAANAIVNYVASTNTLTLTSESAVSEIRKLSVMYLCND